MICQTCKESGQKSRVYIGASHSTLLYYEPYYDEMGIYHRHDGNKTEVDYSCSNGHRWVEQFGSIPCPAGDWPDYDLSSTGREISRYFQ